MAAPEGKAVAVSSLANGAKRIKYKIGPFNIVPGQNEIGYEVYPREAPGRRLLHPHPPRPDLSERPRARC